MIKKELKLAVIGLGYVGLPLAVEFGKKRSVIGFDINEQRVNELQSGFDKTEEVDEVTLKSAHFLNFTTDSREMASANCYIITVPTPIDQNKIPNLSPLRSASETVGKLLQDGDIIIYESTVYPGATEEVCAPILEKFSGLKYSANLPATVDVPCFHLGYSPERINPGDKLHRINNIVKVTSGSSPEIATCIDNLYKEIIDVGTHKAESIKVAEAAKVIENTQRDLNISLINELAIIFNKMDIDTEAVLQAAGTKWNFLPFRPGLVGGHCIGVDPYYLTHKAQNIGYNPEIILAGRRLNDRMGQYIAAQLIEEMNKKSIQPDGAKILIMGLTFKENCPDLRNTKVVDIVDELKRLNCTVDVYDPFVTSVQSKLEYNLSTVDAPEEGCYDAIILAVAHDSFRDLGIDKIRGFGKQNHILYDLKYIYPKCQTDLRL